MFERLVQFIRRPTSRDVIVNTLGNYLNVFFTALFALVLVRVMSPSEYGVLSVLLGISYVLANALDFGTTATIYSYLPSLLEEKTYQLYIFIKTTLYYQTLFALITISALAIFFPYLDEIFFKTNAPVWQLYLALLSVLLFIWQNFVSNILLASKKFFKVNLYVNISNLIKTVILFALIPFGLINVGSVIFVFGVLGSILFFIPLLIEKRDLYPIIMKQKIQKEEFRFGYTLTYFLGTQMFNMGLRMDLFLLSFFQFKNEVGYYGLAQKVIISIMTTIVSVTQVLSPNFSQASTKKEAKHVIKTSLLYLSMPAALFLLLLITPTQVFDLFFTKAFSQTSAITKSLVLPFVLYSFSMFLWLFILYTAKKPIYFLISQAVFFTSMTVGCALLIPKLRVFAPSYVLTLSFFLSSIILGFAAIYEYRKLPN